MPSGPGLRAYTYDAATRMLSVGASAFTYDPVGNLHRAGAALLMSMSGGSGWPFTGWTTAP